MLTTEQQTIIRAAQEGGKIVKKYFGKNLVTTQKSMASDFYTKADIESERVILRILKKYFPAYNYQAEESGTQSNASDYTFYIDPLDGSYNFFLEIPFFGTIITLMKKDKLIFTVFYDPILGRTYYAIKDGGAYRDGKKLIIQNTARKIHQATISYHCGYRDNIKKAMLLERHFKEKRVKRWLKTWTAFGFCLCALGKIEIIIVNEAQEHDTYAGNLLMREAGGIVTDFSGNELRDDRARKFIAASNWELVKEVVPIVQKTLL